MLSFPCGSCGYLIPIPVIDIRLLSVLVYHVLAVTSVFFYPHPVPGHPLVYIAFYIAFIIHTSSFCNADPLLHHPSTYEAKIEESEKAGGSSQR